ncbi:hypothetical protein HAHE_36430 [Haloferula helveola]|uniref:Outer membrane protein beta-barrel domain-containing protein n=1 Tax=Haloferula helveola TaxID=490095 RepID=A0ABN6H7T1_9BACT|nr:hypothetical protein HAHE_36430 [Haloferula helveola]
MTARLLFALLPATPAFAGPASPKSPIEPPAEISPWRIGTGVMWRNIGDLSVSPDLANGRFAGNLFVPDPAAGPANANADRTYDDGYVNQGAATPGTGLTTFWGYQNASQVGGGNLTYTASGGLGLSAPGPGSDDADAEAAPYIEVSYLQPIRADLLIGPTANFSFVSLDGRTASPMALSDASTVDSYALNGVIPPLAGYMGTFAGPGPLIGNQPTTRTTVLTPAGGGGSYAFDSSTDLYSLALGGEAHWLPTDRCYIGFGAGLVLNYAEWDAGWSARLIDPATVALSTYGARSSGDDFLLGAYLKTSGRYRFTDQWSIEAFFRYDWNESLDGSAGPTTFKIDLSGWSAGFGVGFTF